MRLDAAANSIPRKREAKRLYSIWISGLAIGMFSLPALASPLYSSFGAVPDVYDSGNTYIVCGVSACGDSSEVASQFIVAGSGSQIVSQIDLAVGNVESADSFNASIWTSIGNTPGVMVANAIWTDLAAVNTLGSCCSAIVTISDITGVTLTGGSQYFMVLSQNTAQNNWDGWYFNYQGAPGVVLTSDGIAWQAPSDGPNPVAAFDVIDAPTELTPEPGSLVLLGVGLVLVFYAASRQTNSRSSC